MSHAENGDLPEGWHQSEIKYIGDARMGETILAKELSTDGIPVYSAGQANEVWGLLSSPKRTYDKHSIVVSARGSIGFPKIPKHEPFTCTQTTICLTTTDLLVARYSCYFLKTRDWASITSGGAIPMLTVGEINKQQIPLAPLAEQRRIVEKLDAVLGKVDACRQRLERIPTILKRFRQSVLAAACSGKLTADWREEKEIDVSKKWDGGKLEVFLREKLANGRSVPDGQGFPVLRLTCLEQGKVNLSERKLGNWDRSEGIKFAVKKGDFFVARGNGSLRLVGRGALLCDEPDEVAFPDTLIRIRLTESVDPEFFSFLWESRSVRDQIEMVAKTSAGIFKVSQGDLNSIDLAIPTLPEQQEIVHRVKTLFTLADQLEARYRTAKTHVDKLTQSVLAKAFRGELVPTEAELAHLEGRDYEPASVLLERIQAEREARSQTVRKKATRKRVAKKRS